MKDNILKDIALDWRICEIRIKLKGIDYELFGYFNEINIQSSFPATAKIEVWNEQDWSLLSIEHRNREALDRGEIIEISTLDIEDLDIIGFERTQKPKIKKLDKSLSWVSCRSHGQNTLPNLDIEKLNLITDPEVLDQYYNELEGRPSKRSANSV